MSALRPKELDELELISKIFMHWIIQDQMNPEKCRKRDPEIFEGSFICKVLNKRMEAFGIDVGIPDYLSVIIELCTEGNPGQSLMMLSEILENIPDLKRGYLIKPMDFTRVYTTRFPLLKKYSDINERLEKKWDDQKVDIITSPLGSDNACDFPEYWTKFFKQ